MATSLGLPKESVHVICPFIGGAFGSKGWLYAPAAAHGHGRAGGGAAGENRVAPAGHVRRGRAARRHPANPRRWAPRRDGKITALRHDTLTHSSQSSGFTEPCARVSRMMYAVPNMGFAHQLAHLHLPSPCPMRGPGETVGGWALECALDELAAELNLDPVELRLRNYADKNPETGKPWSQQAPARVLRPGPEAHWLGRSATPSPRSMREGTQLIGYGMATTMYPAGRREAKARATIFADGRALVQSATHELGNGAYTIFRQISADALALPVERVRFELGDSSLPSAPTTGGSTTTATVGPAAQAAARAALAGPQKPGCRRRAVAAVWRGGRRH